MLFGLFLFFFTSLLQADIPSSWAPPSSTKSSSEPPPSSHIAKTLSTDKHLFIVPPAPVIHATIAPISLKPPASSISKEFKSQNPYEVLISDWQAIELSNSHGVMNDYRVAPIAPSSIGCFTGPKIGQMTLIINHLVNTTQTPLDKSDGLPISSDLIFDPAKGGGCTRMVIDIAQAKCLRREWSLAGTQLNAGGATTPWGSFLSGESLDDFSPKNHGRLFEILPLARGLSAPLPIDLGGGISIGALSLDENAQVLYIGEAQKNGVLYRFKPKVWGQLKFGGSLSVLGIENSASLFSQNSSLNEKKFFWIDLPVSMEFPHDIAVQKGAYAFGPIGGLSSSKGNLFISLPRGGLEKHGQILRLSKGEINIFTESKSTEPASIKTPMNILSTQNGSLLVCEDNPSASRLLLYDETGRWNPLLWVKTGGIGGVALSPDESSLYITLKDEIVTLLLRKKE